MKLRISSQSPGQKFAIGAGSSNAIDTSSMPILTSPGWLIPWGTFNPLFVTIRSLFRLKLSRGFYPYVHGLCIIKVHGYVPATFERAIERV